LSNTLYAFYAKSRRVIAVHMRRVHFVSWIKVIAPLIWFASINESGNANYC